MNGKRKMEESRDKCFLCVSPFNFNTTHDTLQARSTTRQEHLPSPHVPYVLRFLLIFRMVLFLIPLENSLPLCLEGFLVSVRNLESLKEEDEDGDEDDENVEVKLIARMKDWIEDCDGDWWGGDFGNASCPVGMTD